MTEYYRHNIINEEGMHRFVTVPISMAETLTLRDQFAMAALTVVNVGTKTFQDIACSAYRIADAMIEARKEKK
jgi:hypothetical protein